MKSVHFWSDLVFLSVASCMFSRSDFLYRISKPGGWEFQVPHALLDILVTQVEATTMPTISSCN